MVHNVEQRLLTMTAAPRDVQDLRMAVHDVLSRQNAVDGGMNKARAETATSLHVQPSLGNPVAHK